MEESIDQTGNPDISEHTKRLKERFRDHGLNGFNSREALELLFSLSGTGTDPAKQAGELIARFGSVRGILDANKAPFSSAIAQEGLTEDGGRSDALMLMELIKGLPRSYGREHLPAPTVINTKQDVLYHVNKAVPCRRGERLLAIYLNSRNEVLGTWVLHEGHVSCETIKPKRAIEGALHYNGQGLIFVHRHDRTSAEPSRHEIRLIKGLWTAASALDLIVHDHLIFSRLGLYSALEAGLISTPTENQLMAASPASRNFRLKRT